MKWTESQLRAITERRGDVVVSASAGSGKTAVLTERVLRTITEPNPVDGTAPTSLDRLLIITFTEKATRQMRERIEAAVRERMEVDSNNSLLRDALDKLSDAWIMTIDAFCRRIVMENFHQVGIAPGTRIPDGAEAADLELRILRELLDRRAGESGEAKRELEEILRAQTGSANALIETLHGMIEFLQSLARPEAWLREQRDRLRLTSAARQFSELPEAISAHSAFARDTFELAEAFEAVLVQVKNISPNDPVLKIWPEYEKQLRVLAETAPPFAPEALRAMVDGAAGTLDDLALKRVCGGVLYAEEMFRKRVLDKFCKHYRRWRDTWMPLGSAGWLKGARLAARRLLVLLELAELTIARMETHKRRRGLATFNDFERLALKLLGDDPAQGPTAVAYELRQRFEYVMVDEYQDTSPLQDAIIRRVSRSEDRDLVTRGNLFIVGDVKQSIYRFRHAEPRLFQERIKAAQKSDETGKDEAFRIDLLENFRSRPPILDFVNACFARLMDEAVGELNYDSREKLQAGRNEGEAQLDPVCVEVLWLQRQASNITGNDDTEYDERENQVKETIGVEGTKEDSLEELTGIDAQAAWVAARIRDLIAPATGLRIPDEKNAAPGKTELRLARPGDCAILLRGIRGELETWLTALAHAGLRVRAPGINPLFTALELVDLLNTLRVADNPFQDLPLASVLRSPLFDFCDEELLRIRLVQRHGFFNEAVWRAAGRPLHDGKSESKLSENLAKKIRDTVARLDAWRRLARTREAEVVLETILADTAYEAWLTAQPDAAARLEHIDFLRGLLRRLGRQDGGNNSLASFLELIARAEDDSGALGELPESVAGTGDAINLLTIHKSKGLEFPIVFVPRLERPFRDSGMQDILYDLHGGIGARGIDIDRRLSYPTLAHVRLADLKRCKERSEEMRLLYVAMTRARERLILLGQMRSLEAARERWRAEAPLEEKTMPTLARLRAGCAADLLGTIVEALGQIQERNKAPVCWLKVDYSEKLPRAPRPPLERPLVLRALARIEGDPEELRNRAAVELEREADQWELEISPNDSQQRQIEDGYAREPAREPPRLISALNRSDAKDSLSRLTAKTTVTALKSTQWSQSGKPHAEDIQTKETEEETGEAWREEDAFAVEEELRRPIFLPTTSLAGIAPGFALVSQAVSTLDVRLRGTLHHQFLANLDLASDVDEAGLRAQARELVNRRVITGAPAAQILNTLDFDAMAWFFTSDLGLTMRERAHTVSRELPFTMKRAAAEFLNDGGAEIIPQKLADEFVLVQGMIDVVIDLGDRALIADYKTDRIYRSGQLEDCVSSYRLQLELYAEAMKRIWGLNHVTGVLVFLDARQIVRMF